MKAYKGFNEKLQCRNFQYELDGEYEEPKAELCETGFHACENPIDVFGYYPPANSRYCEVELGEITEDRKEDRKEDSKICGRKIKIGAEIGIKGIIDAFIKFTFERIDWKNSAATNTGDGSAATNTGDGSAATNTGSRSAATNTGSRSAATNTGNYSAATNTGSRSAATNTGDYSAATNTGNYSAATNTGNYSTATVEGKESIAVATGIDSKAKGELGCYIVLAEWELNDNSEWHIKTVKSHIVDSEIIKPNVFYMLKNGKFVEAD